VNDGKIYYHHSKIDYKPTAFKNSGEFGFTPEAKK
jgi:hypothetical protein